MYFYYPFHLHYFLVVILKQLIINMFSGFFCLHLSFVQMFWHVCKIPNPLIFLHFIYLLILLRFVQTWVSRHWVRVGEHPLLILNAGLKFLLASCFCLTAFISITKYAHRVSLNLRQSMTLCWSRTVSISHYKSEGENVLHVSHSWNSSGLIKYKNKPTRCSEWFVAFAWAKKSLYLAERDGVPAVQSNHWARQ